MIVLKRRHYAQYGTPVFEPAQPTYAAALQAMKRENRQGL